MAKTRFQAAAAEQVKALSADPATRRIAEAVLRLAKKLEDDPYRGELLREKANVKPPHQGSPEELTVLAVGDRPEVYRDAAKEAAERLKDSPKGAAVQPDWYKTTQRGAGGTP